MSIESFFTSLIAPLGETGKSTDATGLGLPQGTGLGNSNFADFFFTNTDTEHVGATTLATSDPANRFDLANIAPTDSIFPTALQSNTAASTEQPNIDIAQLLSENPDIARKLQSITLPKDASLSETLAFNQRIFNEVIAPLTEAAGIDIETLQKQVGLSGLQAIYNADGQITDIRVQTDTIATQDIPQVFESLGLVLQNVEGSDDLALGIQTSVFPSLNNLIAEEIAAIAEASPNDQSTLLHSVADQPEAEDGEQPLIGATIPTVQLVIPQSKTTPNAPTAFPISALAAPIVHIPTPPDPQQIIQGHKISQALATRLNSLIVGGEDESADSFESKSTFETLLAKQKGAKGAGADATNPGNAVKKAADIPAGLSTIDGSTFLYPGVEANGLHTSFDSFSSTATQGSVTTLSTLTNVTTQAGHATHAHPATQTVAATISKSFGQGAFKNITIRLDPAELGKVEIRLEFGKEKNVKAQIVSEKPETHLLLQRDQSSLERILQETGLDSDGGLSFSLAEDGYNFDQDGRHDSHAGHKGGKDGSTGETDEGLIIESTMTWHVDPSTGHMRYDILA